MRRRNLLALLGGAATTLLSRAVRARADKIYRIGILSPGGFALATNPGRLTDEIVRQLARGGFTADANLQLLTRGAAGRFERLPALVAELVAAKVDVIVTFGYPVAAAAKATTNVVPIVVLNAGDPVKTHLVASLSRPGGNITGLSDVASLLDDWASLARDRNADGTAFGYARDRGVTKTLLREVLDPELRLADAREQRFRAPRSLRDVEPSVLLRKIAPNGAEIGDDVP